MALYRKLRPTIFSDVIGQDNITKTLLNQITSNRISHAYLFCGTRGTGKTTTAKIFSRAVNCENPHNGNPCNQCDTCLEILAARSMNVLEIDAASNNGVDNIRDIRDEVAYPPTSGHYKVYIIDEVHMLSTGAFNALLKTLEEPPAHVIFILATTDPQKIPATIHSRCQRFDFKRITVSDIVHTLREYITAGQVDAAGGSITDEALSYIATISDGAMRDALSVLEQCISFFYGETITIDKVLDLLGAVDNSIFFDMTDAIFSADSLRCISLINDMIINGRDISQFVAGMLNHFRNILVAVNCGPDHMSLNTSAENGRRLYEQGKKIESFIIIHYINTFSELQGRLRYASSERVLLEVTCIKLCNPTGQDNLDALYSRVNNLEKRLESGQIIARDETVKKKQ